MKQEYSLANNGQPLIVNIGFDTDRLTVWNNTLSSMFVNIGDNSVPTKDNHNLHILAGEFFEFPVSGRNFCFAFNSGYINTYSYPNAKIVLSVNEPSYQFNSNTLFPSIWDRISTITHEANINPLSEVNYDFYLPDYGELGILRWCLWDTSVYNSLLSFEIIVGGNRYLLWDALSPEKYFYFDLKIPTGVQVSVKLSNGSGTIRSFYFFSFMEVYLI